MHNRQKLQEYQLTELPEHHNSDAKNILQDVIIGVKHLYPMSVVCPSSCDNFPYHLFHLEPHLIMAYFCLPLGVTNLWG